MAIATATAANRNRTSRRWLWESSLTSRVDRGNCVIRGVKILGRESDNGRVYLPECISQAKTLYENRAVCIDHPAKATDQRSTEDVFGWLRDVREGKDGGLYGDLHYLKSHPMAERICEAAERNSKLFGLSHNAEGEGDYQNGKFVVRRLTEVRSVDIVQDPATTAGLFESRSNSKGTAMKKNLTEDDAGMGLDTESPVDPVVTDDAGGDWKKSLMDAVAALASSGSDEDHKKAVKIMAMLKPDAAPAPVVEADDEEEGKDKDGDEKKLEEERDAKGHGWEEEHDDERKAAFARMGESKTLHAELARLKAELAVRDLCEAMSVKPSTAIKTALLALPNDATRKALLEEVRPKDQRPRTQRPASAGSNGAVAAATKRLEDLTESKDIAAFLRGELSIAN